MICRLSDPNGSTTERMTLASSLKDMVKNVDSISKQITVWQDRRQVARDYYANKLSYKDVKDLKITKGDLCSLFTEPRTNPNLTLNAKRFSIHWCHYQQIRDHFYDRWYMVFDYPPCNNCDVPQYFLRKLYSEFILKKIPNYFDMRDFQGRCGGSAQDRPGAQPDPMRQGRQALARPPHEHVVMPSVMKESVDVETL